MREVLFVREAERGLIQSLRYTLFLGVVLLIKREEKDYHVVRIQNAMLLWYSEIGLASNVAQIDWLRAPQNKYTNMASIEAE